MFRNFSPWIEELDEKRHIRHLSEDAEADVAIIGGGISGIATAFFILKDTQKSVALVEAGKIAHGATGHNAGQIVAVFERAFSSIAKEFGLEMAGRGIIEIQSGFDLMREIAEDSGAKKPHLFAGYEAIQKLSDAIEQLECMELYEKAGAVLEPFFIAAESGLAEKIPARHARFYSIIPHREIMAMAETANPSIIAISKDRRGSMNSALFSEQVLKYLLSKYPERFSCFELSPVQKIRLHANGTGIICEKGTVSAKEAVLCTNGYKHFLIENRRGEAITQAFHEKIKGTVGYMNAYIEKDFRPYKGINHMPEPEKTGCEDSYFYITRGQHRDTRQNIIAVGGPDRHMADTNRYGIHDTFLKESEEKTKEFLRKEYAPAKPDVKFDYQWHGLMGYTPGSIRIVGREPKNPELLYNLGCNGIGIIPAMTGGKRIARILAGERLPPSIFDPR